MSFTTVVTTIQEPTGSVLALVKALQKADGRLIAVGDQKGPANFNVPDVAAGLVRFVPLAEQVDLPLAMPKLLPTKHYARKNLGYLLAIQGGATAIYETDDDNAPAAEWKPYPLKVQVQRVAPRSWFNVYKPFAKDALIWPRGFPLDRIRDPQTWAHEPGAAMEQVEAPIQQALADLAPDVDAAWRLILDREFYFEQGPSLVLPPGTWCPFNSQNTWWHPAAFALMYLPSYCSFRMTDIWRSFIAQRCLWELRHGVVFHAADVVQQRNEHNLMRDFADEVSGYLKNDDMVRRLGDLKLRSGSGEVAANLIRCYEELVAGELFPEKELPLVRAWVEDLEGVS